MCADIENMMAWRSAPLFVVLSRTTNKGGKKLCDHLTRIGQMMGNKQCIHTAHKIEHPVYLTGTCTVGAIAVKTGWHRLKLWAAGICTGSVQNLEDMERDGTSWKHCINWSGKNLNRPVYSSELSEALRVRWACPNISVIENPSFTPTSCHDWLAMQGGEERSRELLNQAIRCEQRLPRKSKHASDAHCSSEWG